MQTLAIANHKGGVGKTTTAVNLAAALALTGERVLLVDSDAQAHCTLWFLAAQELLDLERDLEDVLLRRVSAREARLHTRARGLDLLPSSLALALADHQLQLAIRGEDRLREALENVRTDYDFVVIDCPPELSLLTVNALVAADGIIAPVTLTNLAGRGLVMFLDWLDRMQAEGVVAASVLGILPTQTRMNEIVAREALEFFRQLGPPLLGPIPRRVAVEGMIAGQRLASDPELDRDDVALAYRRVAGEVLKLTASAAPLKVSHA